MTYYLFTFLIYFFVVIPLDAEFAFAPEDAPVAEE
jgi:hypothetical protein